MAKNCSSCASCAGVTLERFFFSLAFSCNEAIDPSRFEPSFSSTGETGLGRSASRPTRDSGERGIAGSRRVSRSVMWEGMYGR